MKSETFYVLLTLAVFSLARSCTCCSSCSKDVHSDYSRYPKPELTFPGLGDPVAEEDGEDKVWPWIKPVLSAVGSFIPYGGDAIFGFIMSASENLMRSANNLKKVFTDLVNDSLAKSAIVDILAKVVTVQNRMRQIQTHVNQKTSYNVPLEIALNTCEEILQKFANNDSYLFRSGNALISSPALVSFSQVFSGIATLAYKDSPNDREHIVNELTLLLRTLEKYRSAAIEKRISYIELTQRNGKGFEDDCAYTYCKDSFEKVAPACKSCTTAKCQWESAVWPQKMFDQRYPPALFRQYESELKEKYYKYFNEIIGKVGNLLTSLGQRVEYAPTKKFPPVTLGIIKDSAHGYGMVGK